MRTLRVHGLEQLPAKRSDLPTRPLAEKENDNPETAAFCRLHILKLIVHLKLVRV
jgi:hypothetical protein